MSIEYLPVGIACNLKCTYCYQEPMRDGGNINSPIQWDKAKARLEEHNHNFTVFGGEPLLAPVSHLEEVFRFGFERFGRNGIQTNGILIEAEHIELFRKYKVSVGISIDGPAHLNDARWMGDLMSTNLATYKTIGNIRRLCELGIPPALIMTIHRKNAGSLLDLDILKQWLTQIHGWGVRYINLHMLEVEKGSQDIHLTEEENIRAFLDLYEWGKTTSLHLQPFEDMITLLTDPEPSVSCIWNHCDPATTAAVQGVNPDGSQSNCGRTNKDGVNWVKSDSPGFERYLLLHQTPQEVGGCKDCRFFALCKGQCPGTAMDGDWRNRTADCRTWYSLFERIGEDLGDRRLTDRAIEQLEDRLLSKLHSNSNQHGDSPHGDSPHGDEHGDHTDGVPVTWI